MDAGSKIVDNRAFYFKGLCNIFARARIEMQGLNVEHAEINNRNTGMVYINTNAINDATAQNMLYHAQQQSLAFFYRNSSEVRRSMLEIIGYEGIFFDTLDGDLTTPWHNKSIERIPIVYFAPIAIDDHIVGAHMSTDYLGALIDIAIERHEINDFMAGFQLTMELMGGNLHRHRRVVREQPAAPAPQADDDADAGGIVNDGAAVNPQFNAPSPYVYPYLDERINIVPEVPQLDPYGVANRPSHLRADHITYVGDSNAIGRRTYRTADWVHLPLDAFFQFQQSDVCRPMGDNWFYNMLNARRPTTSERLPPFLYGCTGEVLVKIMILGFSIIRAAATSVCIAYNIVGAQVDAHNRSASIPDYSQFHRMFMSVANSDVYMQAPYFGFVNHVVELLTGHKMFSRAVVRTFNNDITYVNYNIHLVFIIICVAIYHYENVVCFPSIILLKHDHVNGDCLLQM